MENLRESSRVEARHFISYDVRNESGEVIYSGIALSRNLSRKGRRCGGCKWNDSTCRKSR